MVIPCNGSLKAGLVSDQIQNHFQQSADLTEALCGVCDKSKGTEMTEKAEKTKDGGRKKQTKTGLEKKTEGGQFINRSFAEASLTFTSPPLLLHCFFPLPAPIKDHKMWIWPINANQDESDFCGFDCMLATILIRSTYHPSSG